ncbi:ABC transporter permease [Celeribacter baekdonensis]|uniref:ABC transporter permease n=1 Tax=Celeribacter baekdonensis TaxID=875171 RepID=A0A2R4M5P3_9RHOB|nr:ABC transporter permease [Celeribacter baekdonensis]AVW92483.1 ABC transporter permease [Celeribacter baekdonensis]|tara:strand:+ start:138252 stop:139070 length:819 start_codon:yes stop_codon:yes gene_type:complete
MFHYAKSQSGFSAALTILRLIFVNTVRHVRKSHGNPLLGLISNMTQALILVFVFTFMYSILGIRGVAIRGDFILFIMSGIFLFLTHNKAIGAVAGAENATSPMMQHAPMNTAISIASAALSTLYIQVLSVAAILIVYSLGWGGVHFQDAAGAFGMLLMAWASGSAIGTVVLAAKPWAPRMVGIVQTVYTRANMFTSGKMFVANQTPGYMLAFFSWNPLFHTIDQARGFTFVNYNPHYSSVVYPAVFSMIFVTIGLLAEFFTRKRVSLSWGAR